MNIQNSLNKISQMLKEPAGLEFYRIEDFWEENKEFAFNFDKYDFMHSLGASELEECLELYELEDTFMDYLDSSIKDDREGWEEFYKNILKRSKDEL